MLKKILAVLTVFSSLFVLSGCGYNTMQEQDEAANAAWSEVLNQYQRRADLIPNLVNTVKGYAKHESTTLENVIAARAKASQITLDPSNATPEQLAAYQNAQGQLSQALGKLMMLQEQYPDLKANEQFSMLQAQLEGTENRINEARKKYNESVRDYNVSVRRFPINLLAGMFGFEKRATFEATADAQNAPSVNF